MATSTPTQQRGPVDEKTETIVTVVRTTQELMIRSLRSGMDTTLACSQLTQRLGHELLSLAVTAAEQTLQLWTDVQAAAWEATGAGIRWPGEGGDLWPWRSWQRLVDGSAHALSRFADTVQGSVEEGTERIKQVVDLTSEQVTKTTADLGQAAKGESRRTPAGAARS